MWTCQTIDEEKDHFAQAFINVAIYRFFLLNKRQMISNDPPNGSISVNMLMIKVKGLGHILKYRFTPFALLMSNLRNADS